MQENDDLLYEYVMEEIEASNLKKGLWAKAIALSEGNNNKTKSLYMQYRVNALKDEFKSLELNYNELPKEQLFELIKNDFKNNKETEKLKLEQEKKLEENRKFEQEKKLELNKKNDEKKYGKIRGWLIFFAIILILGNLTYLQIINFFTDDFKNNIQSLYLNSQESVIQVINLSVYTSIMGLFLIILLTISFFSKSKYTKSIVITFLIFQILAGIVNAGVVINLNKEFPNLFDGREFIMEVIMRPTIGSIILLIWVFYFIFSKRVKKTFINQNNIGITMFISLLLPILLLFLYTSNNNTENIVKTAQENVLEDEKYLDGADYFGIVIVPQPANAQVKIMNIEEVYYAGIQVLRGTYQIQVSAPGYEGKIFSIKIENDDYVRSVTLKKKEEYTYTPNFLFKKDFLFKKTKVFIEINLNKNLTSDIQSEVNAPSHTTKKISSSNISMSRLLAIDIQREILNTFKKNNFSVIDNGVGTSKDKRLNETDLRNVFISLEIKNKEDLDKTLDVLIISIDKAFEENEKVMKKFPLTN